MKKEKIWFFLVLSLLITVGTLFYVTMVQHASHSYANGRFVEQEDTADEVGYYLLKAVTKQ